MLARTKGAEMKELLTKTLLSDKVEEKFWVCWHAARFSAKYSQTSVDIILTPLRKDKSFAGPELCRNPL